jgi:hypothetical protein
MPVKAPVRRFLKDSPTLCAMFVVAAGSTTAPAQITIPTPGVLPPEPITRSLLLGDDLAQIQAWWTAPVDSYQASWKANIESYANRTLGGEPNTYSDSVLHSATGQSAGLRWAMTGSGADLTKAVDALVHMKVVPSPSNPDLTEVEILMNYLCAYDFIRGAPISPADRSTIESKLLAAANEIPDWNLLQQENNILAKRASTRGMAGVLLRNQALLDSALLRLNQSYDKTTTDDGWYTDSQGHYLNYTLPHVIPFIRAYHVGSGVNLWPNIEPFVSMCLGLRLPDGRTPNVQDGLLVTSGINLFGRGVDNATKAALVYHFTTGDPPSFGNILNSDGTYVDFFWSDDFSQGAAPPARSPTFLSPGQAKVTVFRNDWTPNSDYLLMSAGIDGKPLWGGLFPIGHNHNDSGEILLFSHGELIFPAGGYERTDWPSWPNGFRSKLAENHNVLLVNGSIGSGSQTRPEDFVYTDRLDSTEYGSYKGVCDFASLQTEYQNATVRRSSAFPNEDYFVVADVVTSAVTNTYGFNLIGRGTLATLTDSADINRVKWEINAAQAIETVVSTHDMTLSTDTTWAALEWNVVEQTQRMRAQIIADNAGFLSVIETGAAGSAPRLQVTDLSTTGYTAATVTDPNQGYVDLVLAQLNGAPHTVDGITSDGRFVYVRRVNGGIEGVMLAGGTTIADGNDVIFQASAPLTLSLLFADGTIKGTISADEFTADTELRVYGDDLIQSAELNGHDVPFTNGPGYSSVMLTEAGKLVIVTAPAPTYTLTLTRQNGVLGSVDVSPNEPNYVAGTVVALTAVPGEGKFFRHWIIYDPCFPDDANYGVQDANAVLSLVMDSDKHVEAVFACSSGLGPALPLLVLGTSVFRAITLRHRRCP